MSRVTEKNIRRCLGYKESGKLNSTASCTGGKFFSDKKAVANGRRA
jgi:hypothetical protein